MMMGDRFEDFGSRRGGFLDLAEWFRSRSGAVPARHGRLLIAGRPGVGKAMLCDRWSGWAVARPHGQRGDDGIDDIGAFVIADVPVERDEVSVFEPASAFMEEVEVADVVLWLIDGRNGVDADEHRAFRRVLATGRPVIVAAMVRVGEADVVDDTARRMGCAIERLFVPEQLSADVRLLRRLIEVGPEVAVAVGSSFEAGRAPAARHLVRRAALGAMLVGMLPIPLLDLPFLVENNLRLLARLGSINGSGQETERRLVASLSGGVAFRLALQQLVKLIPFAGWLFSGLASAATTLLMGRAAVHMLERGGRPSLRFGTILTTTRSRRIRSVRDGLRSRAGRLWSAARGIFSGARPRAAALVRRLRRDGR